MVESAIPVTHSEVLLPLFGARDQHLRKIRQALGVEISASDGVIRVHGDPAAVTVATEVLERLCTIVRRQGSLAEEEVTRAIDQVRGKSGAGDVPAIDVMAAGKTVRPRTPGQERYVEAIRKHDIVFGVGPAGTGKTYLAVAMAVSALRNQQIRKIVLVRPAVEAGESLGYLPGDLQAKIHPYLRPLLDALHEMIDYDQFKRYTEQDLIEIIPLAYMRGRTLNEAFIILDEAQNTTIPQMKMFLTRMGRNSKIVVSGDTTQADLPSRTTSGLTDAVERLGHLKGFAVSKLSSADIVRHPMVQQIVRAYEQEPKKKRERR
ncbi:MAG: PhoH family protein [Pirellulales bacterium]